MKNLNEEIREGYDRLTHVIDYFIPPELCNYLVRTGKKESGKIKKQTAKLGTRSHKLIEDDFLNGGYKLVKADSYEVRQAMEAWEKFKKEYDLKIVDMEKRLYSDVYMVTARRDMLAVINGKRTLLDLKVTGAIRPKNWIQVAMNALFEEENGGEHIDELAILRLHKNLGEYEFVSRPNEDRYRIVFEGMLNAYRFFQEEQSSKKAKGTGEEYDTGNNNITEDSPTDSTL